MPAPRSAGGGAVPTNEVVTLGKKLLAGKGEIPQSERARALGVAAASVTNYMRVAQAFAGKLPADRGLAIDLGALVVLAHPHVADAIRDEAVQRAMRGERISRRVAENMVAGIGK